MMYKKLSQSLSLLLIGTTMYAWSYEDENINNNTYGSNKQPTEVRGFLFDNKANDYFFKDDEFEEIIRFNMIVFVDNEVDDNSKQVLYDAIQKIKGYQNSSNDIRVTIIGHTNAITEDENEKCVESGTYAKAICNLFTSCLTKADARKKSKEYAAYIEKIMNKNGINQSTTVVDYQSDKDLAFSDSTDKGRDLSNRVMITLYVKSKTNKHQNNYKKHDIDRDGVLDIYDNCPDTPRGSNVDRDGCSFAKNYSYSYEPLVEKNTQNTYSGFNDIYQQDNDADNDYADTRYSYNNTKIVKKDRDGDGIFDNNDKCLQTPLGVIVDTQGCPYDKDKDGVYDYQDKCQNTPRNSPVDKFGCASKKYLNKILSIHFQTGSQRIMYESYPEIRKFASFLKKNEFYDVDIIGHTDSVGKASKNFLLSQKRAKATKEALIIEGIDASRIESYGRGESDPLKSNRTEAGRKANRRIEIKLYRK